MPSIYSYLVDADGQYILTDDGERIIVDATNFEIPNSNMRAVGSSAARSKKVQYIRSFNIRANTDQTTWYLYVNQKTLLGLYPGKSYAIDALYGAFTSIGANDTFALASIQAQIADGKSFIQDEV